MPRPSLQDYPDDYRFRFCPMDGTPLESVEIYGLERQHCPQCDWVHFPLPKIAATTVIEYQGGIVLVQRDIEPDRGMWHLPIGHMEYGEDPAEAALREGCEETGLELADPRYLCYTYSPSYVDSRLFYLVFSFAARAVGGELVGSAEGRNVLVVPLEALRPLKWTSQQAAIEAYRATRS